MEFQRVRGMALYPREISISGECNSVDGVGEWGRWGGTGYFSGGAGGNFSGRDAGVIYQWDRWI